MRQTRILKTEHLGKPLIPSAALSADWDRRVQSLMKKMYLETKRELTAAFKETDFKGAMDASPVSQSRIILNALMSKYEKLFNTLSKSIVDKMISGVMRNSGATLKMSLEGYVNPLEIDRTATNARLKEIIQASSEEAANLIKRIPEKYLGEVQGQVMRSITSGKGLNELVPYLTEKYKGDARWAKHVALDQTRKVNANVNRVRLEQCGVEKFKWVHMMSAHPRKDHIELSGKIFRFDDLPVIDKRTGQKGYVAELPFCKCVAVPVFFDNE